MPLAKSMTPVRVNLTTPGEWVDLKPRLSKGDEHQLYGIGIDLAQTAGLDFSDPGVQDAGALRTTLMKNLTSEHLDDFTFRGLELGIVAWSFPDPVTPDNIRDLLPEDCELLAAKCNELWRPRGEEESRNLSESSPEPSTAKAGGPRSSSG